MTARSKDWSFTRPKPAHLILQAVDQNPRAHGSAVHHSLSRSIEPLVSSIFRLFAAISFSCLVLNAKPRGTNVPTSFSVCLCTFCRCHPIRSSSAPHYALGTCHLPKSRRVPCIALSSLHITRTTCQCIKYLSRIASRCCNQAHVCSANHRMVDL